MKMRTIYLFSLSLVITFIFSSCKDDDVITHDQVKEKPSLLTEANNENYSLDEAKKLANDFFNTLDGVNKLKSGEINTILSSSTHTIKALDSINLYVFNYKKGGFVIINPIKRHSSRILAFSEKDNLPIEKLNSGVLSLWKDYTMECLLKQEIADKNAPKLRSLINRPFPEYIKKLLKIKVGSLTESQRREILNYLHDTDVTKVFAEPIIKTNWHQDFPYNDNCPHHYPAGCVAISVGQILNHYRKWDGESWNWDKVNRSEKPEISRFVRTVGSGVKMTYHKGGSYPDWANLNFITDLNYREVTFLKKIGYDAKSYNLPNKTYILFDELKEKRPVIMSGFKKQVIIPLDGHSWIADGLKTLTRGYIMDRTEVAERGFDFNLFPYEDIPVGKILNEREDDYFHFNFGWGGTNNNWFLYTFVRFESIDFNTHLKFVTVQK